MVNGQGKNNGYRWINGRKTIDFDLLIDPTKVKNRHLMLDVTKKICQINFENEKINSFGSL